MQNKPILTYKINRMNEKEYTKLVEMIRTQTDLQTWAMNLNWEKQVKNEIISLTGFYSKEELLTWIENGRTLAKEVILLLVDEELEEYGQKTTININLAEMKKDILKANQKSELNNYNVNYIAPLSSKIDAVKKDMDTINKLGRYLIISSITTTIAVLFIVTNVVSHMSSASLPWITNNIMLVLFVSCFGLTGSVVSTFVFAVKKRTLQNKYKITGGIENTMLEIKKLLLEKKSEESGMEQTFQNELNKIQPDKIEDPRIDNLLHIQKTILEEMISENTSVYSESPKFENGRYIKPIK